MDGIQKTVCEGLRHLANKVEESTYGKDDNAFQSDEEHDAFFNDFVKEVEDYMT